MTDMQSPARTRLLPFFTGVFVATLIVSNIASSAKLIALGPFVFPGGAVLFPLSFIFGDILTEVYGYERSRTVLWTGFLCLLLGTLTFLIIQALPAPDFWKGGEAYRSIFGFVPRLAFASMTAYFAGEFCNSWVISRMKYGQHGSRGFWTMSWRFVASTIVGEAVDSVVVLVIGFWGVFTLSQAVRVGLSLYVFKVLYEIAALPLSTRVANWVKDIEGVDKIDAPRETNYNPFAFVRLWIR